MDKKIPWNKLPPFVKFKLAFWSMTLILLCLGVAVGCFYLGGTMTIESTFVVKLFVALIAAGFSFVGPGVSIMAIADAWPNERGY